MNLYLLFYLLSLIPILGLQTTTTAQLPPPPLIDLEELSDRDFIYDWIAPGYEPAPEVTPQSSVYRVEVLGDSESLLTQVRKVEPDAFVRDRAEGNRRRYPIIQAGVFSTQDKAQRQVQHLSRQGIRSRIVTVDSELELFATRFRGDSAYYVVIPSHRQDLASLVAQVRRLELEDTEVYQRESPRGAHVAVGPFQQRAQANYWNSYLRLAGFDARLYFGQ